MQTVSKDLKISGSGSAGGGLFDSVEISGSGKINGDIESQSFKSSGASKVYGRLITKVLKVSGSTCFKNDIEAKRAEASGSLSVDGHMQCRFLKASGYMGIGQYLVAEAIDVQGRLKVGAYCSAETFKSRGSFDIHGLLNADRVEVRLYHRCYAQEIGGGTIEVKRGRKGFGLGKFIHSLLNKELSAELIEGDEIYLENTIAKTVRGNHVHIGQGCQIDCVEYRSDIQVTGNGQVKKSEKL
ncbi:hypothetical protein GCM10011391_15220 [Pullulanibacillus camelliae]|uniref:Cytoplasmic protein n=1 Tax=Pullulanibacillus camelliae TaxID=1707096 RepID=A0A8J2VLZ3_9BACL|nr:cell shape determination protein CcmA [Pullulanibacillus camelliae]GGE37282.1 hypothetical protein GCM10011391_15220 [Pullulanibacillus camelliae]